ncbi:MAG: 30S ribosomal protein S8 [Sandaracinaceae bacterium]|nr:MAG: 30S ribosomal protein S8 [Sandaracinaceae bacterium]HBQ14339.1 30S ribosomal protein S8 [Myxococcales bacterium]
MMTDPISDLLARIRNAILARQDRTEAPLSKLKVNIAEILKEEGYISDYKVDESGFGKVVLFLKYGRDRQSAIAGLRRKSRPGRRVYVGYRDIPKVHNGLGVAIMSTSKGVMTDRTARETKLGGEILCEVW